ncbi:hydrogen peroxide-dependent heme synthase, partial [Streptomyces kronopolitis]
MDGMTDASTPASAPQTPAAPEKTPNAGKKAKDLNEVVRYTLWSVFKLREVLPEDRSGYADEVEELFA